MKPFVEGMRRVLSQSEGLRGIGVVHVCDVRVDMFVTPLHFRRACTSLSAPHQHFSVRGKLFSIGGWNGWKGSVGMDC